jgi:hypothetical protein
MQKGTESGDQKKAASQHNDADERKYDGCDQMANQCWSANIDRRQLLACLSQQRRTKFRYQIHHFPIPQKPPLLRPELLKEPRRQFPARQNSHNKHHTQKAADDQVQLCQKRIQHDLLPMVFMVAR